MLFFLNSFVVNAVRHVLKLGERGGIMETASVREIQHHLAVYLDKASKGQEINILRRNRPIARLIAIKEENKSHKADWNSHRDELKKIFGRRKPSGKLMSHIVSDARGDY